MPGATDQNGRVRAAGQRVLAEPALFDGRAAAGVEDVVAASTAVEFGRQGDRGIDVDLVVRLGTVDDQFGQGGNGGHGGVELAVDDDLDLTVDFFDVDRVRAAVGSRQRSDHQDRTDQPDRARGDGADVHGFGGDVALQAGSGARGMNDELKLIGPREPGGGRVSERAGLGVEVGEGAVRRGRDERVGKGLRRAGIGGVADELDRSRLTDDRADRLTDGDRRQVDVRAGTDAQVDGVIIEVRDRIQRRARARAVDLVSDADQDRNDAGEAGSRNDGDDSGGLIDGRGRVLDGREGLSACGWVGRRAALDGVRERVGRFRSKPVQAEDRGLACAHGDVGDGRKIRAVVLSRRRDGDLERLSRGRLRRRIVRGDGDGAGFAGLGVGRINVNHAVGIGVGQRGRGDCDRRDGSRVVGGDFGQVGQDCLAGDQLAVDGVLEVEKLGRAGGDEELRVVRVRAGVGHGELIRAGEGQLLNEFIDERKTGLIHGAGSVAVHRAALNDEVVGSREIAGDSVNDFAGIKP